VEADKKNDKAQEQFDEDAMEQKDEGPGENYVVQNMMRESINDRDGLAGQGRIIT
jgi:hypothetical protein